MSKQSPLIKFLMDNLWGILGIFVVLITFYVTVNFRLMAVEVKANDQREDIDKLTDLVERVIILEQHDKALIDSVAEIKQDVKEIHERIIQ